MSNDKSTMDHLIGELPSWYDFIEESLQDLHHEDREYLIDPLQSIGSQVESANSHVGSNMIAIDRDRLVELVQQMLELHRRRAESGNPRTQQMLDRHITTTDHHIDRLVYELYGLTDEEIKHIEAT